MWIAPKSRGSSVYNTEYKKCPTPPDKDTTADPGTEEDFELTEEFLIELLNEKQVQYLSVTE